MSTFNNFFYFYVTCEITFMNFCKNGNIVDLSTVASNYNLQISCYVQKNSHHVRTFLSFGK